MAKRKEHKRFRVNKEERREKRNKRIMSIVLAAVMVLAVGGIVASNQGSSTRYEYNDYRFTLEQLPQANNNFVFTTKLSGRQPFFYSLPADTLTIPQTGNLTAVLEPSGYIALSTEYELEYAQLFDLIRFELSQASGKLVVGGILEYNETSTLSQYTCENATAGFPVIEFRITNTSTIEVEDNCIRMSSTQQGLSLTRDRLLYSMLGIIEE
jgi:hypothetical protein